MKESTRGTVPSLFLPPLSPVMGIPIGDDVVLIQQAKSSTDPTVITVNCLDKILDVRLEMRRNSKPLPPPARASLQITCTTELVLLMLHRHHDSLWTRHSHD